MKSILISLLLIVFRDTALALPKSPKPLIVRYPSGAVHQDTRDDYDRQVIELMLEKTVEEFGPYELKAAPFMSQSRSLEELERGGVIDVMATTSNRDRETRLLPIKHSIHRTLMGVKLLLIRQGTQAMYSRVKSLKDLNRLVGGQGHDWPDVDILRFNGLTVATGTSYEGLFKMLQKKRFDYFPRALPEIFEEQSAHAAKGLVVEESLAIVYPLHAYLFVKRSNHALAKRFERGFEIAIADGSFKKLFLSKHGENIKRARLGERRIIYLKNPLNSDPDLKVDLNFE